jgi:hypothetical protein
MTKSLETTLEPFSNLSGQDRLKYFIKGKKLIGPLPQTVLKNSTIIKTGQLLIPDCKRNGWAPEAVDC